MMKFNHKTFFIALISLLLSGNLVYGLDLSSIEFPALNKIELPNIKKIQLDNGMRIYLLEDKTLPLIEASARIHGGSYLEPADKVGLGDLMGDLMRDGGTQKWAPDELDEMLEGLGASLNSYADVISSGVNLMMLSTKKELSVELLAEVMRRPRYDEARFEQAMIAYKSGISRRNDNDASIAGREFGKMIYGSESPYARHAEYKTLGAISRNDLIDFHKKICRPDHVQLAVWGDFDTAEMLALIKKYFGDWKKGTEKIPDFPKVDYKFDQRVGFVERADSKQSNVYLGHIGGNTLDPENSHRIVMNNILGVGFGSRLFNEVRSKHGLCYSVYGVYTSNISYPGKFFCYVGTKGESTIKAINLIKSEIERMKTEEATEKELKSAKDRYLNSFVFNFESKGQIIQRMVYYDFFGLPKDFLNKQKEEVEGTTAADVKAAAQKYLKPEAMRVIVVGNPKSFDAPLETLNNGPITKIDVTIPQ